MGLTYIQLGQVLIKHAGDFNNISASATAAIKAVEDPKADKIDPLCTALQAWKPLEVDLIAAANQPVMAASADWEAALHEHARSLGIGGGVVSDIITWLKNNPQAISWIISIFGGLIPKPA